MNHSRKRYLWVGVILTIALVAVVPLVRAMQPALSTLKGGKIKGPVNAPVVIQTFSDFQCPACQRAHETMKKIEERYPGKLRVYFFHFPLRMHQWAMPAHQSAECAARQGKFWPYHDLLYEKQKNWSSLQDPKVAFKDYARQLELNTRLFSGCLDQGETQGVVMEDVEKGRQQQVNSTPTFFVNGKRIVGGSAFEGEMDATIQAGLE